MGWIWKDKSIGKVWKQKEEVRRRTSFFGVIFVSLKVIFARKVEGGGKNDILKNKRLFGLLEGGRMMKKIRYLLAAFAVIWGLDVFCHMDGFKGIPLRVKAESFKDGWKTSEKKRYYYQNGRPVKGLKKIGKNTYYFSKQGVLQKNKWITFGKYKRYFGKNGRMVKNRRIGMRKLDNRGLYKIGAREQAEKLAEKWVERALKQKKGKVTDLRACYNYLKRCRYFGSAIPYPERSTRYNGWDAKYAKDFFTKNGGNCFSYSCGFAFMAKELGYKPKIVVGKAENENGEMSLHAWVEINGRVYDVEREYSKYHKGVFYGRTYKGMKLRYEKGFEIGI